MTRASLLALLLVAACSKGQQAQPASKKDAAVVVADAWDREALLPRERDLPARTACKPDCDAMHEKPSTWGCIRKVPRIVVKGTDMHGGCTADEVVIDCCEPIKAKDLSAVAKALGWPTATEAQRISIGWVIARIVIADDIEEEWPGDFPLAGPFTVPTAKAVEGGVEVSYWIRDGREYNQRSLTLHADGTVDNKYLSTVDAEKDPHVPETYKMSK